MPPKVKKSTPTKPTKKRGAQRPLADEVEAVVASLKRLATLRTGDGTARYDIPSDKALGVPLPRPPVPPRSRFQTTVGSTPDDGMTKT